MIDAAACERTVLITGERGPVGDTGFTGATGATGLARIGTSVVC